MYSLFIDTHNDLMVVGLYNNTKVLSIEKFKSNQSHSNNLVLMIDKVCNQNNIKINDLKEIIVVSGPGSFTGIRIGVTVAKTLAYALNISIKTISSLELKAVSSISKKLKVCVEGDKNGYFVGLFNGNRLQNDMFYLSTKGFEDYLKSNNYIKNVVDEITLDYQAIYDYVKTLPSLNCHEVKPLYVKIIEVQNG